MITQYQDKHFNNELIESSLSKDEEIVCRNATVIADKNGNISWIDNDVPLCAITEDRR